MAGDHNFKRTILITGSTDGIGRQTALELAVHSKENFVIVHGRSEEKCQAAIDYIMREAKLNDKSNLDFVVADFSDLKEVSNLATEVEKRFPRLNILLCNAGVLLPKRTESRDGLELTFQVNHLAHFLIINRLLERLKANQPSRIIVVSSSLHSWHKIDWRDMMAEQEYDKYLQFSRTKLMNHLTTFALHRLLVRQGCHFRVTANVVDLGNMEPQPARRNRHKIDWRDMMAEQEYDKYLQFSRTKLMNHLTTFALHRLLVRQGCHFRVTANVVDLGNMEPQPARRNRSRSTSLSSSDTTLVLSSGVGTLLTLIESPSLECVSGKYFDCHGKQIRSGSDSTDERLQQKLWELTFVVAGSVNHLAPYILSRSLFGLLKKNAPSRLVLVSSICYEWFVIVCASSSEMLLENHCRYSLDWSDLESKKSYEKYTQYSRTKLMVHLTAFKLARLFDGSGVTCNVLEPGVIETKLLRVANVNGAYYDSSCKRVTKLFKDSTDVKQQDELWQFTENLCKQKGIKLASI
ncbi:unnamed protein product [Gongylonema pulchrum]|uniref:Retinol dehydrogenase 14 n=1 Tax=Gongylonema pulchrum TaxID=637853 RepID=A0A183DTC9_9BILA|nr:unnamed protein product [Gongylonema pulchrum]